MNEYMWVISGLEFTSAQVHYKDNLQIKNSVLFLRNSATKNPTDPTGQGILLMWFGYYLILFGGTAP